MPAERKAFRSYLSVPSAFNLLAACLPTEENVALKSAVNSISRRRYSSIYASALPHRHSSICN
jgi:hypothetical protein